VHLHHKIRELDIYSHPLSKVLESKDIFIQQLMSEHKQLELDYRHFQSLVPTEERKPNVVHEKTKVKYVHGNGMHETIDIRI
jgi:hypothetical protein